MKNKFIYIILLVFLLSIVSVSSTFCLEPDVIPEDFYTVMTENDKIVWESSAYYFLMKDNVGRYQLFYSANPITVKKVEIVSGTSSSLYVYGSLVRWNSFSYDSNGIFTNTYNTTILENEKIYYVASFENYTFESANFNVVDKETGEVFMTPPLTGTLAPIVEGVETEKTLEEIVLILPLIIVIVVSFLGLRKALRMLSMLLRRS